jgi:hypothetical protein
MDLLRQGRSRVDRMQMRPPRLNVDAKIYRLPGRGIELGHLPDRVGDQLRDHQDDVTEVIGVSLAEQARGEPTRLAHRLRHGRLRLPSRPGRTGILESGRCGVGGHGSMQRLYGWLWTDDIR